MDRRLILALVITGLVGALGIGACGPAPSGLPVASPTAGAPSSGVVSPTGSTPTAGAAATPSPTSCYATSQLIAERAKAADTGFPIPVEWIGLGPADETFFTLSDVAPRIMIDPLGFASITIGLQYISAAGDRYALTGGSLDLAYDPATGRVSGPLDTGYGKNSNRATTDTVASAFEGVYTRPVAPSAIGLFEGTVTHVDREDYHFKVQMTETSLVLIRPDCASPRPTDTP